MTVTAFAGCAQPDTPSNDPTVTGSCAGRGTDPMDPDDFTKLGNTVTTVMDALLKSEGLTVSASLDALIRGAASLNMSLDALLRKSGVQITTSLDAVLTLGTVTRTKTASLDALLTVQRTLSSSLSALLFSQSTENLFTVNLIGRDFDGTLIGRDIECVLVGRSIAATLSGARLTSTDLIGRVT